MATCHKPLQDKKLRNLALRVVCRQGLKMFNKKNIKNMIFNSAYQVVNVLFPIIIFPYVSRVIGVEGIGIANLALVTATYFSTLASMGIPIYGIREVAKVSDNKEKLNFLVSELLTINALCVIVSVIIYLVVINNITIMSDNIEIYYIAMINIVLSFFQIDWLFQGLEKFKFLAVRGFLTKLLSISLVYTLINDKGDVGVFVFINVLALSAANLMNILSLNRHVKLTFKKLNYKRHFQAVIYFFSTRIMSTVYTMLDSVILGIMTSNYFVGLYTIAIRLVRVITSLIASVVVVFFAESSRLSVEDTKKYQELLLDLFVFLTAITIPCVIYINEYSNVLVELFAGSEFKAASLTLKILSCLIFISIMTNFIGVQILYANGKEKIVAKSLAIGAVSCIFSNVLFIPIYKHNGAAIAAVTAELSILIFQVYSVKISRIKLPNFLSYRYLKVVICGFMYYVFLYLMSHLMLGYSELQILMVSSVLSIPLYFLLLCVSREKLALMLVGRFVK